MSFGTNEIRAAGILLLSVLLVVGWQLTPAWGQARTSSGRRSQPPSARSAPPKKEKTPLKTNSPQKADDGLNAVLHGGRFGSGQTDEYPDNGEQAVYYGFYKDMDGWLARAGDAKWLLTPKNDGMGERPDAQNWTLIHFAAADGNTAAVEFLRKHGAAIDTPTKLTGSTPLYLAMLVPNQMLVLKGGKQHNLCKEMVEFLIAAGADVNKAGKVGTPLHSAAKRGYADVIEMLVKAGADVDARDLAGNTPLHVAGTFEARDVLVRNGADVNITNVVGITPLHVAAGQLFLDDVGLLLSNGADPSIRTSRGASPAVWAGMGGDVNWEMMEVPRRYEAIRRLTVTEVNDSLTLTRKGEDVLGDELRQRYSQNGVRIVYNTGAQGQCPRCRGTGQILSESVTAGAGGSFEKVTGSNGVGLSGTSCPECRGTGKVQGGPTEDDEARAAKSEEMERSRRGKVAGTKDEVLQMLVAFGAMSQSPLETAYGLDKPSAAPAELKEMITTKFKRDVAERLKPKQKAGPQQSTLSSSTRASVKPTTLVSPATQPAKNTAEIAAIEKQIREIQVKLNASAPGSSQRAQLATQLLGLRKSVKAAQAPQGR